MRILICRGRMKGKKRCVANPDAPLPTDIGVGGNHRLVRPYWTRDMGKEHPNGRHHWGDMDW
jgi:hypothetical protein